MPRNPWPKPRCRNGVVCDQHRWASRAGLRRIDGTRIWAPRVFAKIKASIGPAFISGDDMRVDARIAVKDFDPLLPSPAALRCSGGMLASLGKLRPHHHHLRFKSCFYNADLLN